MLPEDAWIKIDVRDGEKGPLVIEAVKCRVQRGPTRVAQDLTKYCL